MSIEGEKNKWDNPDILRALTEFAGLAIEEEKLNHRKEGDDQGETNDIVAKKEKLFKELLGYGLSEGEIFEAVNNVRDKIEDRKEEMESERIRNVLEKAVALYKENSEKGEVYLDLEYEDVDKYGEPETKKRTIKTKIVEIDEKEKDAVLPEGKTIPLGDIQDVELVDEA